MPGRFLVLIACTVVASCQAARNQSRASGKSVSTGFVFADGSAEALASELPKRLCAADLGFCGRFLPADVSTLSASGDTSSVRFARAFDRRSFDHALFVLRCREDGACLLEDGHVDVAVKLPGQRPKYRIYAHDPSASKLGFRALSTAEAQGSCARHAIVPAVLASVVDLPAELTETFASLTFGQWACSFLRVAQHVCREGMTGIAKAALHFGGSYLGRHLLPKAVDNLHDDWLGGLGRLRNFAYSTHCGEVAYVTPQRCASPVVAVDAAQIAVDVTPFGSGGHRQGVDAPVLLLSRHIRDRDAETWSTTTETLEFVDSEEYDTVERRRWSNAGGTDLVADATEALTQRAVGLRVGTVDITLPLFCPRSELSQ